MLNSKLKLSKYKRKQMTVEEIDHYENSDENGNYLIEEIDYCSYTIGIWKLAKPDEDCPYLVTNDFSGDDEDYAKTEDEAYRIVTHIKEEIEDEENYYEED